MAVAASSRGANPLARESQLRPRQTLIAGVAGVCLLAAAVVEALGPQPKVSELTLELIVTNQRVALELVGAVINSIGLFGLALTLNFLYDAAKVRRPESAQATKITALLGGVLAAVGGVAYAILLTVKAHEFVTQGTQTYVQANNLVGSTGFAALQYAGLIGSLLLAIAFVLVSMNAMRVGLITKFLGYLGMAAAAASLFLIGSAPALLIEVFWLIAVAYLLAGRWPNGDPPSWASGKPEPWPTAAEIREQRAKAGGGRAGTPPRGASRRQEQPKPAPATTRATTPKRKRKRRG
jgi:hypothetical protein